MQEAMPFYLHPAMLCVLGNFVSQDAEKSQPPEVGIEPGQQDLKANTLPRRCNAQVTHSRTERRISHGYDPASFVEIRIGP